MKEAAIVAWFQIGDYVVAAVVLVVCSTWYLARQLGSIRLEIAKRIAEADARLRAIENSIDDLKKDARDLRRREGDE